MLDFNDQIGSSNYQLVRTDSKSYWLYPSNQCGAGCPSIERHIVKMRYTERAIAARRQIVADYRCPDGSIHSDYTPRYRQYVIDLASNALHGPLTVAQYDKFVATHPQLAAGLNLLDADERFDGPEASAPDSHMCRGAVSK